MISLLILRIERAILRYIISSNSITFTPFTLILMPLNFVWLLIRLLIRVVVRGKRLRYLPYLLYGLRWDLPGYVMLKLSAIPKQEKLIRNSEWKVLIILDALRYDYFVFVINKMGLRNVMKYSATLSAGAHTHEWALKSLRNLELTSIVYISANPFISYRFMSSIAKKFYRIEPVWLWGFSRELGTVDPRKVMMSFIRLIVRYPDKRFIVHFVQPHPPYIGKIRLPYREEELFKVIRGRIVDPKLVKLAYLHNIYAVMPYVLKICEVVKALDPNAKVVITSDHGDMVERGAHYYGLHCIELTLVPWCTVDLSSIEVTRESIKLIELIRKSIEIKKKLTEYRPT